jgi:predicted transcriptional regulator
MTFDQLLKHYGTQVKIADALGVSQPCVSNWAKRGRIPALQQMKVHMLTGGTLKLDKALMKGLKVSSL